MSILVGRASRVLVQGITGQAGSFHAKSCQEYGTKIVAGVTPGKGGGHVNGIPIFDTVEGAVQKTGADTSLIFVPPAYAKDAILEAASSGIKVIVCVTEGIPALDMACVKVHLESIRPLPPVLIGPNCPGLITPGEAKVGIMPGYIHKPGRVGIVSRSGTLTYEAVWQLTERGFGQSTVVGIGGDPILGTSFVQILELFEKDSETDQVILIGEIGGTAEEEAADYYKSNMSKPLFAFVAGRTAPPGKRMGHAGAIISGGRGTAHDKMTAFQNAGVQVVDSPAGIGESVARFNKQ